MPETLSDITEFIIDTKHKTPKYVEHGYPCIRTPNIGRGYFKLENVRRVSEETYREWVERAVPQAGDLVFAREAPVGNVAIIPHGLRLCIGQRTVLIRPRHDRVDARYVMFLLLDDELQDRMASIASGATVPHLNMSDIRRLAMPELPPVEEQRRIASILSAYDDLIENNLRRIEILEEMAQALYREWFVKFRFPGHEKVRMVESVLGEIPEGWRLASVGDVAGVFRGRSYRSKDLVETGGCPFVNLKCVDREGGFRTNGLKRYDGPYKETQTVQCGAIVMAVTDMTQERRIVARAARVPRLEEPQAVISMDLVKIEPRTVAEMFLYGLFRFSSFPDEVKQYANGANVLHLSPDRITEFRFPLPPQRLQQRYSDMAEATYSSRDMLERQNTNLRRTRDLLLPKLISGELEVSELDTSVPEAVG